MSVRRQRPRRVQLAVYAVARLSGLPPEVRAAAIAALVDLSLELAIRDADDCPARVLGRLRVPDAVRGDAIDALVQHGVIKIDDDRVSVASYIELHGSAEARRARRDAAARRTRRHRAKQTESLDSTNPQRARTSGM